MTRFNRLTLTLVAATTVAAASAAPVPAAVESSAARPAVEYVRPIEWRARIGESKPPAGRLEWTAPVLRNAAVFCHGWIAATHPRDAKRGLLQVSVKGEHEIRPAASAAFALAVAFRTGLVSANSFGEPTDAVARRTADLVKGLAARHRANGGPWGHGWQTALWATLAGHAGWMLWDGLDAEGRRMVAAMVTSEADRFIRPGYKVPYWNGRGGDTKAEENAWNAMILQLAVAMMPDHPHAADWKRLGSELMVSAFATERDAKSNEIRIDGRKVKDWLGGGYNMYDDGRLINHSRVHPDYMTCVTQNLRAHIVLPLAGRRAPEAANFNAARVYKVLTDKAWPSPPYEKPGGTIYRPGKPFVYYPQGTDWSLYRLPIYAWFDAYATVLGWDKRADAWLRLRCEKMLAMQRRHEDRRMYAEGEFDSYPGREQMTGWLMADAHLLLWLDARGLTGKTVNWLAED